MLHLANLFFALTKSSLNANYIKRFHFNRGIFNVEKQQNIFGDHALEFLEYGISTIPLDKKSKKPSLNDWSKYCKVRATDNEIESWAEKYKDYNIGLPLGAANGIVAFDLDYLFDKAWSLDIGIPEKDFNEWKAKVVSEQDKIKQEIMNLLPRTPCVKIGKDGKYCFFYKPKGNFQSIGVDRHGIRLFDILWDGKQTVLPPSIHPDTGLPYKWTNGNLMAHIDDLPELDWNLVLEIKNKYELKTNKDSGIKNVTGRNDLLKKYLFGMFGRGTLPKDCLEHLLIIDQEKNSPPLFSDKAEFGRFADDPRTCAKRFIKSNYTSYKQNLLTDAPKKKEKDSRADPYDGFKAFFDEQLSGVKRDLLSGRLMIEEDGQKAKWVPVGNMTRTLKSYAISSHLKKDDVESHLSRYTNSFKKELLIYEQEWDGVDRIYQLRDCVEFKELPFEAFCETLKQWGANTFKRLENPSNQNICPIFKGDQGLGKDYLIERITGGFKPYYAKLTTCRDEVEVWRQIATKIIMHIPEFDNTSKMPIPFLKDIITRDYVELRPLYASDYVTYPCHTSFISSANIDGMLRDTTGNRRFMIFDFKNIVKRSYPENWSEQVYAQFKQLNKNGFVASAESINECSKLMEDYEPENIEAMIFEVWEDRVSKLCKSYYHNRETMIPAESLTFAQIEGVINDLSKMFKWKPQTISFALKRNGYKRKHGGTMLYFPKK